MEFLFQVMDALHRRHGFTSLVHGAAKGADELAGLWASSRRLGSIIEFPANWDKHGRRAGPIRNQEMIETKPDMVVAFPGGTGTADMVKRAKQHGIPVQIIGPKP